MEYEYSKEELRAQAFLKPLLDYFGGYFEHIGDDVPDGAWFQMHVDGFAHNREEWGDFRTDIEAPSWPDNIDDHEMMMAYIALIGEDAEG